MVTRRQSLATLAGAAMFSTACSAPSPETKSAAPAKSPTMTKRSYGQTKAGEAVDLFTITNAAGVTASITNYGGIVTSLMVPDRAGKMADVVLGFDSLEGYLGEHPYFGALIGRYGNRIGKARFTLNGKTYKLAANNNGNHLHGGLVGFDKKVWTAAPVGDDTLELTYLSKDGEEGYPGNLSVKVRYTLTADNELKLGYEATTDKATVLNLTNHSYFHLGGAGSGDSLGHRIQILADRFTPVDKGLIPTGELRPVEGTPFDFRTAHAIGERIDADEEQIRLGGGYDHNFVLNSGGGSLATAAIVVEPVSGRRMEVLTTQPGVQFYTGNFLDGSVKGKGGIAYQKRFSLCLETQHFPDSPNKPKFPSVVLEPGAKFASTTVYRFGVAEA
jgi:aldose 1-epimerase